MPAASHALAGWWRYSELNGYQVGATVVVTVLLWLDALVFHIQQRSVAIVFAVVSTAVLLVRLAVGAARAERARRYGCW